MPQTAPSLGGGGGFGGWGGGLRSITGESVCEAEWRGLEAWRGAGGRGGERQRPAAPGPARSRSHRPGRKRERASFRLRGSHGVDPGRRQLGRQVILLLGGGQGRRTEDESEEPHGPHRPDGNPRSGPGCCDPWSAQLGPQSPCGERLPSALRACDRTKSYEIAVRGIRPLRTPPVPAGPSTTGRALKLRPGHAGMASELREPSVRRGLAVRFRGAAATARPRAWHAGPAASHAVAWHASLITARAGPPGAEAITARKRCAANAQPPPAPISLPRRRPLRPEVPR